MKNGEAVKHFKAFVWNNGDSAKVAIPVKLKDGTKERKVKEYKMKGYALKCCMNAVIKYWKPFNPSVHTLTIVKGHQ